MPPVIPNTPFLDDFHKALAAEVDAFCRDEVEPHSGERSNYSEQAIDFVRRLAGAGLLRHVVPLAHGGLHEQLDVRSLCLIRRGLARYSSLADTMFAMQGLGSYPITIAGSAALKAEFLPSVANGSATAAFALTEPHAGSDAAGVQTTARREGAEYVLETELVIRKSTAPRTGTERRKRS